MIFQESECKKFKNLNIELKTEASKSFSFFMIFRIWKLQNDIFSAIQILRQPSLPDV